MYISRKLDGLRANLQSFFQKQVQTSLLHRAICRIDHAIPLRLSEQEVEMCHKTKQEKIRLWKEKHLHGRQPNEVSQDYVASIASNYWQKDKNIILVVQSSEPRYLGILEDENSCISAENWTA